MARRKIAILGGGVGGLTTAWGLTESGRDLDVTVYTLGWRLGGKGACSRNPRYGQRIEEHGLHEWFGFYENAFATMRGVFAELGWNWRDFFVPHDYIVFAQRWPLEVAPGEKPGEVSWGMTLPTNPGEPGDGHPLPSAWEYAVEAVRLLQRIWHAWHQQVTGEHVPHVEHADGGSGLIHAIDGVLHKAEQAVMHAAQAALDAVLGSEAVQLALEAAMRAVQELARNDLLGDAMGGVRHLGNDVAVGVLRTVLRGAWAALGPKVTTALEAYHKWLSMEFVAINLIGALSEDVLVRGFHVLDDRDYRKWLKQHGISQITLDSTLVQAAYDSSFAFYRDRYDMEAGAVLRGAARMMLLFKGSVIWRFTGGCADVVFAPLYLALKKRGVKFEFFTQVEELRCTGDVISEVVVERQARPKHGEYDPLIEVAGWHAWPLEPKYEQLVEGERLRASGENLESWFTTWRGRKRTLKRGKDFDDVVLAFPPMDVPQVTRTLAAHNRNWAEMLAAVKTTRTQAFQLWLKPDLAGLGWTEPSPVLSCYGEPLDTWADLSLLLPGETWPPGHEPKTAAYFCGAMTAGDDDLPPRDRRDYPAQQDRLAREDALLFIKTKLPALWPEAFDAEGEFRWDLLVDPEGRAGEARFDSQFWRANIDPSERYVLSVPGSSAKRLKADASGFHNLWLAGDWTDNGLNAGCMEAAVISGLQASRGLCGWPHAIPGEGDKF